MFLAFRYVVLALTLALASGVVALALALALGVVALLTLLSNAEIPFLLLVIVLKLQCNDRFGHRPTTRTLSAFPRDRLPSVLLNSATKIFVFIRVSPLDGVTRGGPSPSDATVEVTLFQSSTRCGICLRERGVQLVLCIHHIKSCYYTGIQVCFDILRFTFNVKCGLCCQ